MVHIAFDSSNHVNVSYKWTLHQLHFIKNRFLDTAASNSGKHRGS